MRLQPYMFFLFLSSVFLLGCKQEKPGQSIEKNASTNIANEPKLTKNITLLFERPEDVTTPKGMVWIPGGAFEQGAVPQDQMAMSHEKPAHGVIVDGFFMDETEVTNAQFKIFVAATGYKTVAEQEIDWEELKKQLPEGTPKPHDSIMQPGSLTFKKTKEPVTNLYDFSQWWRWTIGANWKHPNGPGSDIEGKDNEPVVHIAYDDALAYCNWAGRRLPTEAEWELAARGADLASVFTWGNDPNVLPEMANTWNGQFPVSNSREDGFENRAPVKTFPPNRLGLYDMAGNVWEWTSDWYNTNYYDTMAMRQVPVYNPMGPEAPFNERDPYAREKVVKGGSYLCSASYCASYRISARMATSLDSSQEHLGFRTVATVDMARSQKPRP